MNTLELAKLIKSSGCEVTITPAEHPNAVYIAVRKDDKAVKYGVDLLPAFSDPEAVLDHTIEMSIGMIK
jgi:hypothetical protein